MPVSQRKIENDKKKAYLKSYRECVWRVCRIEEEIKELEAALKSVEAIRYSGMPYASGGFNDMSNDVIRLMSLIDDLKNEKKTLIEAYENIKKVIENLEEKNEEEVLFYRYIKGLHWWEIAEKLHYSERWILKIHGRALAHIQIPDEKSS